MARRLIFGQRVQRIGSAIVLTISPKGIENLQVFVVYPGEVRIPDWCAGLGRVDESAGQARAVAGMTAAGATAIVQFAKSDGPLTVRNRRPGDRFRPLGLGGGKKLQDFFVDRKVARQTRDSVPLVVDESDRIIWVAGHGIDERFRVTDPAQGVVVLRLKPA